MEENEILKITKEYHENTEDNVIGVGFGFKMVNGLLTGEKSIVFTVKEKLTPNEITPQNIIPKIITISGVDYKTDVVQGTCEIFSCDPWNPTPTNRNKIRPLKGGISTTNYTSSSGYIGTLGFLAKDNETDILVGVSNNHVLIDDAFFGSLKNINGSITNVYLDQVTQPNEGGNAGLQNSIGIVSRYQPVRDGGYYNLVDVALTTINSGDFDSNSYLQEGLTNITNNIQFATTSEINNLLTTNPDLYSAGRTTGAKGEGIKKLKVSAINQVLTVSGYLKQGIPTDIYFNDCIQFITTDDIADPITYICPYPIDHGDSGSAVFANIGGVKKIIGLAFSGSPYYGYACRIDHIVNAMNISVWNGEPIDVADKNNIAVRYVDGLSDELFIDFGGLKHWQVGLINI